MSATAACCCLPPRLAAISRARPLWSMADRWWRCGAETRPRNARGTQEGNAPMDFTLLPEIEDVRVRTRRFVEEHVMALEADRANYDSHENIRLHLLGELQAEA